MLQMFDKVDRSAPISLLGDLLSRVSEIGKRMGVDMSMSETPLLQLCQTLLAREGEATGLAQARHILERYQALSAEEKCDFFLGMMDEFGTDKSALDNAVDAWLTDKSEATARELHFAAEPTSQRLIRRLNQASNATLPLVNMRADLLGFVREHPSLEALDKDFAHLFSSWFNRGFLRLQRIDWETSASVLEKIIAYEAVHEIGSWRDLRQRVAAQDRRLYGYFHPALGMEPLIFVEVALMDSTATAIAPVLSGSREFLDPEEATTAVFYSISNCQAGLKGISFGNFLIKQVVESLHREFANLKTFITLSPVPGFKRWALKQLEQADAVTTAQDINLIRQLQAMSDHDALVDAVTDNTELKKLAAKYLVSTRSPRGGASDPVSRFHLGNGARLENIHTQADISDNGLDNAWGCMVNYQYVVRDIEKNHEAYVNGDEVIASSAVQGLLK